MHEAAMQSRVGIRAQDEDARAPILALDPTHAPALGSARQVADRAGDDRHPVAPLDQVARQLVVACASGLVERCERLVN